MNHNTNGVEILDIKTISEFHPDKVIRKIPIMTDRLSASVLFLDQHVQMPPIRNKGADRIHYIIKGSGQIQIGPASRDVNEGMILIIPGGMSYSYINSNGQMIVLSLSSLWSRSPKKQLSTRECEDVQEGA